MVHPIKGVGRHTDVVVSTRVGRESCMDECVKKHAEGFCVMVLFAFGQHLFGLASPRWEYEY